MTTLLAHDLVFYWQPEIPVIPAYHPSYLLRRLDDPAIRPDLQDTIARFKRAWEEAQAEE
jgi:uracil-DNA glycosylase